MPLPGTLRLAAKTYGSCPRAFSSRASPSVTISTPARWSGKNWWTTNRILIAARRTRRTSDAVQPVLRTYDDDYTALDAPAQETVEPVGDPGSHPGEPAVFGRQVGAGLGEDGVPHSEQREPQRLPGRLHLPPEIEMRRRAEDVQE